MAFGFYTTIILTMTIYLFYNLGKDIYINDNIFTKIVYWIFIVTSLFFIAMAENNVNIFKIDKSIVYLMGAIPLSSILGYFHRILSKNLVFIKGGILGIFGASLSYFIGNELLGFGVAENSVNSLISALMILFLLYNSKE